MNVVESVHISSQSLVNSAFVLKHSLFEHKNAFVLLQNNFDFYSRINHYRTTQKCVIYYNIVIMLYYNIASVSSILTESNKYCCPNNRFIKMRSTKYIFVQFHKRPKEFAKEIGMN